MAPRSLPSHDVPRAAGKVHNQQAHPVSLLRTRAVGRSSMISRRLSACIPGSSVEGRAAFSSSAPVALALRRRRPAVQSTPLAFSIPSAPETAVSTGRRRGQQRDYSAKEQYARQSEVPRRIHILGTGSVGKLVAHSLRNIANPPPVSLIFHRHRLLRAWEKGRKEIVLQTDGYNVAASGFDVELAVPLRREHGVPVAPADDQLDRLPRQNHVEGTAKDDHEAAHALVNDADGDPSAQGPAETRTGDDGPSLDEQDGQLRDHVDSAEPIHGLIVTVKAPFTVSALSAVRHRILPTSTICFLQNGAGVIQDVNAALFPDPETRPNYVQGIITHGVNSPDPSRPFFAVHAGHGTIALGILPRSESPTSPSSAPPSSPADDMQKPVPFPPTARYMLRTLTRTPALAAVGMPPADLHQQQLEKLAINAVINPLTVVLDAPNGSILYNYAMTRTMRLLLAEISLVLRSLPELRGLPNVATRFSAARLETLVVSVANTTRHNVSSMLADARAGRRTEIRWINGYIVRRGEELGLQCVCNYMLMQMVEAKCNMIERELMDHVPVQMPDLTGEK
ncbi:hypothetical protein MBLNU459_g7726t1 [Dothideomycetes sp. NU459]